jgi:hypothetical protein
MRASLCGGQSGMIQPSAAANGNALPNLLILTPKARRQFLVIAMATS